MNAGRLRVKLTDATDLTIKELNFHLREISLLATDTLNSEEEWVSLEYNGGEYDLLKLFNGKSVMLVDQYFPAGRVIRKVRLLLGNNNKIMTNTGKSYPLQLPSEHVDGFEAELKEPILMKSHIISSLVIDVNAAHSIRELNGNYFLNPNVRAFPETYGSTLRGHVTPLEFTLAVAILKEPDTLFTVPEIDGMFSFSGLDKGEWEVYVFARPGSLFTDTAFTWSIDTTGVVDIQPKPIQLPHRQKTPNQDE